MPNTSVEPCILKDSEMIRTCTPDIFQELAAEGLFYGLYTSPFGEVLVACLEDRLCGLIFRGELPRDYFFLQARNHLKAELKHYSEDRTRPFFEAAFSDQSPPLLLSGTPFQLRVWRALPQIKRGSVKTYQDLALLIDAPRAMRSIGQALKANPIVYILPCHRVISSSGKLGGYRWGSALKKHLLITEGYEAFLDEAV